jgi:hypothetical protein
MFNHIFSALFVGGLGLVVAIGHFHSLVLARPLSQPHAAPCTTIPR